jgi:hypothetical protein
MKFPDDPDKYGAKWFYITLSGVIMYWSASYIYTVFF